MTTLLEDNCDCSFMFNDTPTQEEIEHERRLCSTADQWRRECELCYPGIDAEEQYQLKLEENRQEKIKRCGSPFVEFNPETGAPETSPQACEICPHCLAVQAGVVRESVLEAAHKYQLRLAIIPESERGKTVRRIKAHGHDWQLFVVSTSNGNVECHILTDDQSIGKEFDAENWKNYHLWIEHFKPEGKRNSGKLIGSNRFLVRNQNQEESEDVIDSGQVLLRRIHPEFEKLPEGISTVQEALNIAGKYAVCQTKDMAPQDIDELQECLRKREQLAIDAIHMMGGVIYGVSFRRTDTLRMTLELPERWLKHAKRYNITQWRHLLE